MVHKLPSFAVTSGAEAIELFRLLIANDMPVFRVVLLDYSMPGLNGPKTSIEILKLCEKEGVSKPTICCVTAY